MSNNGPHYAKGRYTCEITDQGLTKAQTGTVQIVLRFTVLEMANGEPVDQQYSRTCYLPVTEKTMQYLAPKLEALGYNRESLQYLDLTKPNYHDLRGQRATFFCNHEKDQDGNLREKWDVASNRVDAPLDLKPLESREIRQLDLLFAKSRKAAPLVSKPRQVAVMDGPSDDDVPFS